MAISTIAILMLIILATLFASSHFWQKKSNLKGRYEREYVELITEYSQSKNQALIPKINQAAELYGSTLGLNSEGVKTLVDNDLALACKNS